MKSLAANANPLISRHFHHERRPRSDISWRRAGAAAVVKNLDDLVRTRNRIAHGATDVDVSKAMVTRFRRYIEGFA